ncbi:MAG: c-type cytochrome [Microcoleaceae cyanobacterium]
MKFREIINRFIPVCLGLVLLLVVPITTAKAAQSSTIQPLTEQETIQAAEIFQANCAGCHARGGNIVRRRKTLKQKALERNGVDSLESVVNLVTHGKGIMSAYEQRLNPEEIAQVSAYVLQRADQGWL